MCFKKNNRRLLIHIGFPKAASTMLQKTVFPNAKGFAYMGKDDGIGGDKHLLPVSNFIYDLAFAEDRDLLNCFKNFDLFLKSEEIRRYGSQNNHDSLLISHEKFMGALLKPINTRCGLYSADAKKLLCRLKDFGNMFNYSIEILIIKRSFKDFVFSWYAQYYNLYHLTLSTNTLKKYLRSELSFNYVKSGLFWFYKENLDSLLFNIFGKERVHVLDFKELVENNESESYKKMQALLKINLPDFKQTVFNKRAVGSNKKVGTLVATNRTRKSFIQSVKLAWDTFKLHYYDSSKLTEIIEWNEECDVLYQQMVKKFEQEASSVHYNNIQGDYEKRLL